MNNIQRGFGKKGRVGFSLFSVFLSSVFSCAFGTCPDYDGDGRADFMLYGSDEGVWRLFQRDEDSYEQAQFGWAESLPVVGDYDGDGKTDFAVYNEETGCWYLLFSSTWELKSLQFGGSGYLPVSGDYDGDGISDFALYHRDTGTWFFIYSSEWSLKYLQFGSSAMRPLSGDYDGDGKSDLVLYERAAGIWYVLFSGSGSLAYAHFGSPGARPVPGDYDGDGKSDLAVFEREGGAWFIFESGSNELQLASLGGSVSIPVPSDYDGDGKCDLAVYDRNSGEWEVLPSGSEETLMQFCSGGMVPLQAYCDAGPAGLACLAFGDSITYGIGTSSAGPATAYPAVLERRLAPAFGGHFYMANAGVPGEVTAEGIERFEAALLAHSPELVLIMEGTNDGYFSVADDEIESNLRAMVETALARGVGVVIATIPPVISNSYRDRSAQMARIQGFNPRVYAIASDYSLPVARVFEAITAVPNWQNLLMDQPSANHPNDAGSRVVADAFFDAIKQGIGLFY